MKKKILVLLLAFCAAAPVARPCTNLIVTKGASQDGSVMVSYSADSHQLYGELYFWPSALYEPDAMLRVVEWDTGRYMGLIPQAARTYNVTGNMNEHQLIIAESTFGGREGYADSTAIMDYGSLIYIALQRCKTAREAMVLIDNLMQTYGYASSGESFTLADPQEVWVMEIMAKAPRFDAQGVNQRRGAVWVARRIPDGTICAHANQARITTLDFNDPENCRFSPDVISHARETGIFDGTDAEFSFADVYAPLDFGAMRGCEARVWDFFNRFAPGMEAYVDYALGHNPANRMPLYVTPSRKLGVKDVADMMRSHYEDTPLDMRYDVGAGGNELPYRWRPMSFEVDGKNYVQERAIATQQTGWWFVAQSRSWIPEGMGGLFWFGVDDAGTSALTPIYTCATDVPPCLRVGNGSMLEYSETSLFWIMNRVCQFAYLRYNPIGTEVRSIADAWERDRLSEVEAIDTVAAELLAQNQPRKAREFLTRYSVSTAQALFYKWKELDKYLMVKYIDGNIKLQNPDGSFQNNGFDVRIPKVQYGGYSESWFRRIAQDHGEVLQEK